jgi:hypothetical protein
MSAPSITSTPLLDSLITPDTLASRLDVKLATLAQWRTVGFGPAFIRVGRSPRYRPEAVDEWLLAQERTSTFEEVAR